MSLNFAGTEFREFCVLGGHPLNLIPAKERILLYRESFLRTKEFCFSLVFIILTIIRFNFKIFFSNSRNLIMVSSVFLSLFEILPSLLYVIDNVTTCNESFEKTAIFFPNLKRYLFKQMKCGN